MRRQLPVYSPLTLPAILGAASAASTDGAGEREALRAELAERFDADSVLLTDSGTHALQIALERAPSLGTDGVVAALPGYSCYDLVTAAAGAGVRVRFYDVDPVTLAPDLDSVRGVVRAGVSVVVAGNLYGYPLDWSALSALCTDAGVPVIEDAAQGVGSTTQGVGSTIQGSMSDGGRGSALGAATVLSFGRGKGWTGGGGGALLVRDDRFRRESPPERGDQGSSGDQRDQGGLGDQRDQGGLGARSAVVSLAAWGLGRPALYAIPTSLPGLGLGETHYREPSPPRDIPTFSAALARRTADPAEAAASHRRETARRLLDAVWGDGSVRDLVEPCVPAGGPDRSGYLRLPVLARTAAIAERLARQGAVLGIARGYPRPLHHLPPAKDRIMGEAGDLPGSLELAGRLVTLPTHRWVTDRDMAVIGRLLKELA